MKAVNKSLLFAQKLLCVKRNSDEVFLQTMIANSEFRKDIYKFERSSHANVRLIDWDRRVGNSPHTFRVDDYESLISADEDICFARKFSENIDFEVVKKLYNYLQDK